MLKKVFQVMYTEKTQAEAKDVLRAVSTQLDCLGGRVIPPHPSKPGWRDQTFFRATDRDPPPGTVLDSCTRMVLVQENMFTSMGLEKFRNW